MSNAFEQTWQTYTAAWKAGSEPERQRLFEAALDPQCNYTDPLVCAQGWAALSTYMSNFQQQFPGGHFVTTRFMSHNGKCLANWEMRGAQEEVLSDGVSYGEFNPAGKLVTMTGFFATPGA